MVNTIYANEIDCIVCKHENDEGNYFLIKPETRQCKIKFRMWNNMILKNVKVTYLPINCNISTTGHKLQGKTLDHLVINSFAYKCTHWVYVVLSRVKQLINLILNQKLDIHRDYKAKPELVKWELDMKKNIEARTFKDRGKKDYEKYLREEEIYNI